MKTVLIAFLLAAAFGARAEDPIRPAPRLTPGGPAPRAAGLQNYRWQSHVHGLFELPIAA